MTIKNSFLSVFSLLLLACTSCNNEIGESKDVNQETIYQQYRIQYDAADKNLPVQVRAQFRFAGENGTTLVLSNPSAVAFDGQQIPVDSNSAEGAFYALDLAENNFFTSHQLLFTDINGKKFQNNFSFDRFKLAEVPLLAAKDQPLRLAFEPTALAGDDFIEVVAANTDSSFSVQLTAGQGNLLVIPATELKRQTGSELTLEINQYKSIPLQQSTKEGGEIILTQSLVPVKIKLVESSPVAKINY